MYESDRFTTTGSGQTGSGDHSQYTTCFSLQQKERLSSPERSRLQQLQAQSALLQQQSIAQQQQQQQQQQMSLESLAPWGGGSPSGGSSGHGLMSRPGSPTQNKTTGWRGVVP